MGHEQPVMPHYLEDLEEPRLSYERPTPLLPLPEDIALDLLGAEATGEQTGASQAPRNSGMLVRGNGSGSDDAQSSQIGARILVVDDDLVLLRSVARALRAKGFEVWTATDGWDAVRQVNERKFDAMLSDIAMPNLDGIELLREVREHDLQVPVVLFTGEPTVNTAVRAIEYGAFHYLTKPAPLDEIHKVIAKAVQFSRMARLKQEAAEARGDVRPQPWDRAGLETRFRRCLQTLWIAYQPIVRVADHSAFGYEALLRSMEPSLPNPEAVITAAERLGRVHMLGTVVRERACQPLTGSAEHGVLFVNLHPSELLDPTLYLPDAALSAIAHRVILEVTERSAMEDIPDIRSRVARLRELGFRIALDDFGAGSAGLSNLAKLEPEILKLDMSLVRDVHLSVTKRKVVRSMTALAKDMGMMVVAEGIETADERNVLAELGCDLLQGYYLGRPSPFEHWQNAEGRIVPRPPDPDQ
jgi:EAL domain-containing protein (putative c-di-GMP-specific phosphodiesterase class I)/CheY-like chemotaxis protein